ncbi:unnamed protein product, partial [Allacma fusca]
QVLTAVKTNLIDAIWPDRPARPLEPVKALGVHYSGKSSKEKLNEVREEMSKAGAGALVVSELDEIAWLLNLRGSDIHYNPVFFSYVIVTPTKVNFFINSVRLEDSALKGLKAGIENLTIHPYESILEGLVGVVDEVNEKIWLSKKVSAALASSVPDDRRILKLTPISLMKSLKNSVEVQGIINCHVRDAAALCNFFAWLEEAMLSGQKLTEISAADKLQKFRE